jgi:hypothetical protein
MPILPAARWDPPELVRRLVVSLGVLALYRVGSQVPLPGIDAGLLFAQAPLRGSGAYIGLVSIMTLGMTPLLSALILVEMTKTFWPSFTVWAAVPRNERRIELVAVVGALGLAALQAGGLAIALEDVVGLVPQPGFGFRLGVVVSLTAATAVLIWLAAVISRHGVGHGFWILLIAPHLITATQRATEQANAFDTTGPASIALTGLLLAVSVAVLATLLSAKPPLTEPTEPAWVSILGFALAGWVVTGAWVALALLAPEHAPPFEQAVAHEAFFLLCLVGMALVAGLRQLSLRKLNRAAPPAAAMVLVAALTGLVAFGTALSHISDAPLLLPPTKVLLLAAAGLIVLHGLARPEFEPAATLSTSGAASTPDPQS